LYDGQVLVFRQVPALQELISYTDTLLREHLGEGDPTTVQTRLNDADYLECMGRAQHEFRTSKQSRQLFFAVLQQIGVDTQNTFWDHFPLRAVPYGGSHRGGRCEAVNVHRDTWGANINCQLNWWAPIYPLSAERTMVFYPDYWQSPLANDTHSWSFDEYIRQRNLLPDKERAVDYSSVPLPQEAVDDSHLFPVLIEAGDLLCFASAHLHGSVENTSARARFSVEMRTVNVDELQAGYGAPNVDNVGVKPMYEWFRRIKDNRSLAEVMTESVD
jgi:hypothetical protein